MSEEFKTWEQMSEHEQLSATHYDLYKDVYGIRPRWFNYEQFSVEELKKELDNLLREGERVWAEEKRIEAQKVEEFKAEVQRTIELGAKDEATALRWMTQSEKFYHSQDVEHWVWNRGILFTDFGRELCTKLESIVRYEEYA